MGNCCNHHSIMINESIQVKDVPDRLEYPEYLEATIVVNEKREYVCIVRLPNYLKPMSESTDLKTE